MEKCPQNPNLRFCVRNKQHPVFNGIGISQRVRCGLIPIPAFCQSNEFRKSIGPKLVIYVLGPFAIEKSPAIQPLAAVKIDRLHKHKALNTIKVDGRQYIISVLITEW
jgi:hypothetical protein